MPAYNAELYVREAIASILNQTLSDFEFIIYNDGSTDSTDEIIQSFNDDRIVYINNRENKGYLVLLNEGLNIARGRYIARMDADDISSPDRFEQQFNFLESHPNVGICGSWYEFIGEKSGVERRPERFEEIQYHLFYGCPLTHPTIMLRNQFIQQFGLRYDEKYYYAEDHEFFFRASFHFEIVNLPLVLLKYRIHSTQVGSSKWMQQAQIKYAIQSKMFAAALNSCSTYDSDWLDLFFKRKSVPDENWLSQVIFYKKKIIDDNEKSLVYPTHILAKAANDLFEAKVKENYYQYFFDKYYNQKRFNLPLLFSFCKEKSKAYKILGMKLSTIFAIKCLLHYQKKQIINS